MGFEKNLIHFDVAFEWRVSVYHGKSELSFPLSHQYLLVSFSEGLGFEDGE